MSRPASRPDQDAYELLETESPQVGISLSAMSDDDEEEEDDLTLLGDLAEDDDWLKAVENDRGTSLALKERLARRPFVVGLAVALLLLLAIVAAALANLQTRHMTPSPARGRPPHIDKAARVQRDPSVSLVDYLELQFGGNEGAEGETVVMWTMATGYYVPQARNWDSKRSELGMDDAVVVLCLDSECLDECERGGLRGYGGYLPEYVDRPPETHRRKREKRGAERGHFMAFLKFKAMLKMAQSGFPSLFFEVCCLHSGLRALV